jgi:hypothetical protein
MKGGVHVRFLPSNKRTDMVARFRISMAYPFASQTNMNQIYMRSKASAALLFREQEL